MARLRFMPIIFVVLLCGTANAADTPTPLMDSIEALNGKIVTGYFDQEGYRAPPLTKDSGRLRPLSKTLSPRFAAGTGKSFLWMMRPTNSICR